MEVSEAQTDIFVDNPQKKKGVQCYFKVAAHCLKITQNVAFEFLILAFSTNFCPIKIDQSGNTV